MAKGYRVETFAEVLRNCSSVGLPTAVQCMLSFPSETAAEAEETVRFLLEYQRHISMVNLADFSPVIGSPVMKDPDRFGIIVRDDGDYTPTISWEDRQGKDVVAEAQIVARYGPDIHDAWPHCLERFAGATGGAHALLYAARFGADFFHVSSESPAPFPDEARIGSCRPELRNALRWVRDVSFTLEQANDLVFRGLGERPKRLSGVESLKRLEECELGVPRTTGASQLLWRIVPAFGVTIPEEAIPLLDLMDGVRTVDDIVAELTARSPDQPHRANMLELCRELYDLAVLGLSECAEE
jgi:hypothetical protein